MRAQRYLQLASLHQVKLVDLRESLARHNMWRRESPGSLCSLAQPQKLAGIRGPTDGQTWGSVMPRRRSINGHGGESSQGQRICYFEVAFLQNTEGGATRTISVHGLTGLD